METFCDRRIWYLNGRFITYTRISEIYGDASATDSPGGGKVSCARGVFVSLSERRDASSRTSGNVVLRVEERKRERERENRRKYFSDRSNRSASGRERTRSNEREKGLVDRATWIEDENGDDIQRP